MRYKLKGLIMSMEVVLVLILIMVGFGWGIIGMREFVENYRTQSLIADCKAIDNALQFYARSHRSAVPSSVKIKENPINHTQMVVYESGSMYPTNTEELGLLLSQFGYMAHSMPHVQGTAWTIYPAENSAWKTRFINNTSSDSNFRGNITYEAWTTTGNVMKYRLTATLPNGTTYVSEGSN